MYGSLTCGSGKGRKIVWRRPGLYMDTVFVHKNLDMFGNVLIVYTKDRCKHFPKVNVLQGPAA